MTLMRLGLMRDLQKICQVLSRARPRSTGALAADRARFLVGWVRVSSPLGGRPHLTEHIARVGECSTHELGIEPEAYDSKRDVNS